jgi:hypothetical protein
VRRSVHGEGWWAGRRWGREFDDTAGQAPYYCIYNGDNDGLSGVKHQCSLEYDLDVTFTLAAFGSSFEVPLSVTGVQTANDSTYEHPFVMACCTDIRDAEGWPFDDSCVTRHHEACMSDFIHHVCKAPGNWLEASAGDFVGGGKEAIDAAAAWLKEHEQECYDHFWLGPDMLFDAAYCSPEYDGFFDHTPWEPSETFQHILPFSNVILAEVSSIVVAPRSSFGQNVPLAPPVPAEECSHPGGNDGEVPPLSTVEPVGESFAPVAPAPIEVVGPMLGEELIGGAGELGTDSVLHWFSSGDGGDALVLERWVMTEAAATTIGTSVIRADVDHFKLALVRPAKAHAVAGGWHIDPGSALFNASATIDGSGSSVQATNSSGIELRMVDGGVDACATHQVSCLVSDPFTITYEDAAEQQWMLKLPAITWQP